MLIHRVRNNIMWQYVVSEGVYRNVVVLYLILSYHFLRKGFAWHNYYSSHAHGVIMGIFATSRLLVISR